MQTSHSWKTFLLHFSHLGPREHQAAGPGFSGPKHGLVTADCASSRDGKHPACMALSSPPCSPSQAALGVTVSLNQLQQPGHLDPVLREPCGTLMLEPVCLPCSQDVTVGNRREGARPVPESFPPISLYPHVSLFKRRGRIKGRRRLCYVSISE